MGEGEHSSTLNPTPIPAEFPPKYARDTQERLNRNTWNQQGWEDLWRRLKASGKSIPNPSLGNGEQLEGNSKRMIPAEWPSTTSHHHPGTRGSIHGTPMGWMAGGLPGALAPK